MTHLALFTQSARLTVVVAIISAAACAPVGAPREFPTVDDDSAAPLLIVARLVDGSYLPPLPRCTRPHVTCLDPPPFWLEVKVDSVVFGDQAPDRLYVATTSHYGMEGYVLDGGKAYLLRLSTDGRSFIMPRYASGELRQDRSGENYLVYWNSSPIWWLPCSASDLREDVEHVRFERIGDTGAVPRYVLSVSRLRSHLRSMNPKDAMKYCEAK